ncbi:MAG TPA: carboxypeptidase-like regulatory domain-containing protein [Solirubrobacteraceae bacterium]|nr:carboxypeptidase-like regulatory domain-containing protein [Solirubrobacteraceae bacterium]
MSATLLALTVLLLMAAASPRAEAASTASISGKVTDSHGNPITTQDICVSADRTEYYENESDHLTTTDSSGDYTITGLAAGSYEVYFSDCENSARNDVSQYYDDQTEYESATTIALTEGQARTGIDDSLAAATTISGNVYAGAGTSTPLQGICVDTYSTSGSLDYGVEVKTAADGSYTITHVVPGVRYEVEFYDCNPAREYLTQYYNGVSENGPGTTVTATLASPATGIDAHMEKGASISGTVTDSKGNAITTEDICVSALQPDDEAFYSYGEAKTNSSGQYTIGGLKPGSYDVYFADCYGSTRNDSPQYYDQQNSATFAEAVTLKAAQTQTGVDASLEPATTISGHIYAGSGTSTPLGDICVYAYIANNTGTYYSYYGSSAQAGADGSYTLTHIEPNVSYDIEFFECGSGKEYLTQYYDGASDTLQATTITPTTSPLTGIDAHMERARASAAA